MTNTSIVRPATIDDCFRLLSSGVVDGVGVSELPGRASIMSLGLTDRVRPLEPPLALATDHIVISKTHPHARTMLYYVNSAMAKIRESGEYDRIVERHLARFWESQAAAPHESLSTLPAASLKGAPAPAVRGAPAAATVRSDGKTVQ